MLTCPPHYREQITAVGANRAAVTVEGLIKAEEARAAAMVKGQIAAAVAAIKEKGILSGKRIERSERANLGDYEWLERLSADELRAYIAGEPGSEAGVLKLYLPRCCADAGAESRAQAQGPGCGDFLRAREHAR
jgi:hypothetical protein